MNEIKPEKKNCGVDFGIIVEEHPPNTIIPPKPKGLCRDTGEVPVKVVTANLDAHILIPKITAKDLVQERNLGAITEREEDYLIDRLPLLNVKFAEYMTETWGYDFRAAIELVLGSRKC